MELELWRREQVEGALTATAPSLAALRARAAELEAALDQTRTRIRRHNAAQRRKDPEPRAAATATEIRARLRETRAELKEARKAAFADPAVQRRLAAVDVEHRERTKRLRAESGLYWGTYLTVEQAFRGSQSGAPPRFVGRREPGKVAVQLQGGATWKKILEGHTQCRVEILPPPPNASSHGRRSKRPRALLHIRVGSEGQWNRTSVWAQVPFVLHRPLPEDGRVKWECVVRRWVGTHAKWSVQFRVSQESWERADPKGAEGMVAVDLGWRTLSDSFHARRPRPGRRRTVDDLTIPERLARWYKPDEQQSIRDRNFT